MSDYTVEIYNLDNSLYGFITQFRSLTFTQRVNAPWDARLEIVANNSQTVTGLIQYLMQRDQMNKLLFFKRRDSLTSDVHVVYGGIITTITEDTLATGDLLYTLYSRGFTDILNYRYVIPVGEEYQIESGVASKVIIAYTTPYTSGERSFPVPFVVAVPDSFGNYVTRKIKQTRLLDVIQSIAEEGETYFGVDYTFPPTTLTFKVKNVWGTDRRNTQVFSLSYGNIKNILRSYNTREEINYVYVGGAGQGEERTLYETNTSYGPWGRKEGYTDAREENTTAGYRTVGQAFLEANKPTETFSFELHQTTNCRWLYQWELGDLISVQHAETSYDKLISEVTVDYNDTGREVITTKNDDA